ncbi:lipopolysaccharide biosynthesis protein [Clostridium butyricum]
MALMNFLGNLIMWLYVPKIVLKVKLNLKEIFSNFKPTVYLFIPQLAVQIYSILDKTQLGILSNVGEVGLYEQSQKIIRLLLGIITCLSAVMLPRMSNIFANGDTKTMNKYFNVSLKCVTYISIPMAFGLIAISDQFVPWFFGPDFIQVSVLIKVLTPIFFFIGISSVMGNQYLIPTNRIRPYTFSVVLGSVVNLLLNLILIPKYQAAGTCIASVFAEFSVALVQCILLKDCIDIGKFCINLIKYIISGIVMITVIKALTFSLESSVLTTMIQVLLGFISYFLMLTMMKEEINLIAIKSILSKIRKKDFVHFS